jgi:hypothetical protein
VRLGLMCGRELQSAIPALGSTRNRSAHFLAVRGATVRARLVAIGPMLTPRPAARRHHVRHRADQQERRQHIRANSTDLQMSVRMFGGCYVATDQDGSAR